MIVHSFPQEDIDATETEISSVQDSLDVLDYNEVFTEQVNQFPQNTIVDNEQSVQNFDDHGPDHSSGKMVVPICYQTGIWLPVIPILIYLCSMILVLWIMMAQFMFHHLVKGRD